MWPTVQGFSLSTTQTLLENHSYWVFEALGDARVVSPSVVAPLAASTNPVDEELRRFVMLAYAKQCIGMICFPLMDYLKRGGRYGDLNLSSLSQVVWPLIECYASSDAGYMDFVDLSGGAFLSFLVRFCKDKGPFGAGNTETRLTGLHVCCHTAALRKDRNYFREFVEGILLRLHDDTAKIAGTHAESHVIARRGQLASAINQTVAEFKRRNKEDRRN